MTGPVVRAAAENAVLNSTNTKDKPVADRRTVVDIGQPMAGEAEKRVEHASARRRVKQARG